MIIQKQQQVFGNSIDYKENIPYIPADKNNSALFEFKTKIASGIENDAK